MITVSVAQPDMVHHAAVPYCKKIHCKNVLRGYILHTQRTSHEDIPCVQQKILGFVTVIMLIVLGSILTSSRNHQPQTMMKVSFIKIILSGYLWGGG